MGRRMYNRSGSWAEQKLVVTLTPALPGTVPLVLPCLSQWGKTEGASVRANAEPCRWVKEIRVRRETHGLKTAFDPKLALNLGASKGRNPEGPKIRVFLVTFGQKTIPFLLRGSRARSR